MWQPTETTGATYFREREFDYSSKTGRAW